MRRIASCVALVCSLGCPAAALAAGPSFLPPAGQGPNRNARMVECPAADFDRTNLLEQGEKALGAKEFKWRHAQTDHFAIHYENAIFAQKVARMAEFFYDYISADLRVTNDLHKGRSHIFIFNSKKDWETFQQKYSENPSKWVASWVRGPEMYLQQTGGGSDAADTLGHEMTHLIINRFFDGDPPLAINEGVAEWYEEFAYSAFKGVKKSKKQEFARLNDALPLGDVLSATKYPDNDAAVHRFYATAKYFIGYLMIRQPPEKFGPFFADLTRQTPLFEALAKHYDLPNQDVVEKEFAKFIK